MPTLSFKPTELDILLGIIAEYVEQDVSKGILKLLDALLNKMSKQLLKWSDNTETVDYITEIRDFIREECF